MRGGVLLVAAAAVAAVAVAVRLAYLVLVPGVTNADDAATAWMARRIADGNGYVWFAGQDYMGAAQQYLQAIPVAVLPDPLTAARLVDIALSGLVAALVVVLGSAVYADRVRAVAAGLAFAVGPAFTVHFGARALGGYVLAQLAGVLALVLTLHLRRSAARAAGVGAAAGLVLYLSPTALCLAAPALLWCLPDLRARPRLVAALAGGLTAALTPVLGWMLLRRRMPGLPAGAEPSDVAERLGNALGPLARELVGVAGAHDAALVPGARLVVPALLAAWLVAAWRRRRGLAALFTGRTGQRRPVDPVLLTVPVAVALHGLTPAAWYTGAPRYLFALAPAVAVLLAGLLPRGRMAPAGLLVAAVAALTLVGVPRHRGTPDEADVARLADALAARDVAVARADYWTAVPLLLAARNRFAVVQVGPPDRFPELRPIAGRRPPGATAHVTVADTGPVGEGGRRWSCGPFTVRELPTRAGARGGIRTPTPEGTGT